MSPAPAVVRVITWLPIGGIERRLVAVLPRLRDLGWSPRLVCIREEGPLAAELRDAGIPVTLIPFRSRLSPGATRRLARYLTEHQARVVHSHMYRSNVPATVAGRLAGVPAVFAQVHNVGTWETSRQRLMDRLLSRWRTGTIAVSRAVQQDVMANLRLPEERVPVLYNGIDMEGFQPSHELREETRARLGVAPDRVLVVVPARLHEQKNPLGVLEAFRHASRQWDGPKPVLAYAGAGKAEEELREAIAGEENVLLLGQRSDMPAIYNAADVILLSSFKEGFSNAVVEALACGKPVIASNVGGNAEAVNDEKFGWIHDAGDGAALSAQLHAAFRRGVDGLGAMAADCRARAGEFSLDALVRNTDALYRKALGVTP